MIWGFILPVVDIHFIEVTYSIITVWIFGLSFTNIVGERINFFYSSTILFGIILLISGFIKLKISYDARREKHGNHSKWILISSVIDVIMLIISVSLIWFQKSFFTTNVGYTLSLDDVSVVLSLGFYAMLVGAILGFVAVGGDKIYIHKIKDTTIEE